MAFAISPFHSGLGLPGHVGKDTFTNVHLSLGRLAASHIHALSMHLRKTPFHFFMV